MRYLACQLAVTVGSKVLAAHYCPHLALLLDDTQWPALTAAQVAQFTAAGISCTEVMIQLEPQNPKSVFVAASGGIWSPIEAQQAVDMHLSLCSLAQQQGSDWWVVRGAMSALTMAGQNPGIISCSSTQAALAAFQEALQAPLRCCQRLLPALWVQRLQKWLAPAMPFVAVVEQHLASLQSNDGGGRDGTSVGGSSTHEQTMQAVCAAAEQAGCALRAVRHERDLECSGCGQPAVGLRRCSRCKMAQYCR